MGRLGYIEFASGGDRRWQATVVSEVGDRVSGYGDTKQEALKNLASALSTGEIGERVAAWHAFRAGWLRYDGSSMNDAFEGWWSKTSRVGDLDERIRRADLAGRKLSTVYMNAAHLSEFRAEIVRGSDGISYPYKPDPNAKPKPPGWVLTYKGVDVCRMEAAEVLEVAP